MNIVGIVILLPNNNLWYILVTRKTIRHGNIFYFHIQYVYCVGTYYRSVLTSWIFKIGFSENLSFSLLHCRYALRIILFREIIDNRLDIQHIHTNVSYPISQVLACPFYLLIISIFKKIKIITVAVAVAVNLILRAHSAALQSAMGKADIVLYYILWQRISF